MVMSPEIRIVATEEPGPRGDAAGTPAETGRAAPEAGADAPVGTATKPAREKTSLKNESAAAKGESDSGTGSGDAPIPGAAAGNARSTSARNPGMKSRSAR